MSAVGWPHMHPLKLTGAILATVAVVCAAVVQFTPWASVEVEGGNIVGFSFPGAKVDAYTWEAQSSSGGNQDSVSWYDSDHDDSDGIGQIRAGIPFLLAGLILGLAGVIVLLATKGPAGAILTLVSGLVMTAGTALFAMGTDTFFDGNQDAWGPAFYLAITAAVLLVVGGVFGLVAGNASHRTGINGQGVVNK